MAYDTSFMEPPVSSGAPSWAERSRQLARLIRLPNLLLMGLCLLLVRVALLPAALWRVVLAAPFALLVLATLCVAAAGYIINDYYDVKIDAVNRPGRLVIGRLVNRRHAMMAHLILSGIGIVVAGVLSPLLGLVHVGSALLLWGYSVRFKRVALVGNVSIATLTAALVLLPELQARTGQAGPWVYALGAFLLTMVREIVKDVEDMRGDAQHDCHTLPIVWGVSRTKWIAGFFLLCLLLLTTGAVYAALHTSHHVWLSIWLIIACILPVIALGYQLRRADRRRHFAQLSAWCKWIMLAGVLSIPLSVAG